MIEFLSDNIWTTIKTLSEKSKRTKVAVAYFGTGASQLLQLKKGDTLIVAMHLNNVKAGQVNPFEIEKLLDKGVLIYNLPNLHSKIYLLDKKVIIGSANVSSHSVDTLIETGILTDDTTIISDAEKFIKENAIEKVEQDYIELCKENYSPPKFFGKKAKQNKKDDFKGQLSRMWVISTTPVDFDEDDYAVLEKDEKFFETKITNKKTFELTEIKYDITQNFINKVQEGDIIIEIEKHKVQTKVIKPKRALGVTFNKKKEGAYLRVEERKKRITKGWTQFDRFLKQNGIKSIKKNSTREIKNQTTKKILLEFFG